MGSFDELVRIIEDTPIEEPQNFFAVSHTEITRTLAPLAQPAGHESIDHLLQLDYQEPNIPVIDRFQYVAGVTQEQLDALDQRMYAHKTVLVPFSNDAQTGVRLLLRTTYPLEEYQQPLQEAFHDLKLSVRMAALWYRSTLTNNLNKHSRASKLILPNEDGMRHRISRWKSKAEKTEVEAKNAVLFVGDLDNLKRINELGTDVGDDYIEYGAGMLLDFTRKLKEPGTWYICHAHGDEFIWMYEGTTPEQAAHIVKDFQDHMHQNPFRVRSPSPHAGTRIQGNMTIGYYPLSIRASYNTTKHWAERSEMNAKKNKRDLLITPAIGMPAIQYNSNQS